MNIIPQKRCAVCGVDKPLTEFHKRGDKYKWACKDCRKAHIVATPETILSPDTIKTCRKCKAEKPAREFDTDMKIRSGYKSTCIACRRATSRAWKDRNKDRVREYRIENREHLREKQYAWARRNPDRVAAIKRRVYAKSKEYYRKKHVQWYTANREYALEHARAYSRTPRGRIFNRLNASKHRAMERRGDVTIEQLNDLMQRQKKCYYCKCRFTKKCPATVDHVIPLSRGGAHTISNLVLACKPCNSRKHANIIFLL